VTRAYSNLGDYGEGTEYVTRLITLTESFISRKSMWFLKPLVNARFKGLPCSPICSEVDADEMGEDDMSTAAHRTKRRQINCMRSLVTRFYGRMILQRH